MLRSGQYLEPLQGLATDREVVLLGPAGVRTAEEHGPAGDGPAAGRVRPLPHAGAGPARSPAYAWSRVSASPRFEFPSR